MKLVLLLVVAVSSSPYPLEPTDIAEESHEAPLEQKTLEVPGQNRDEKLFSVFQIVRFANDPCTAVDGSEGTCFTSAECTEKGGEARGKCASDFGVCCISVVDPNCPSDIKLNNTRIVNPGYPGDLDTTAECASSASDASTRQISRNARQTVTVALTYEYTIKKISDDVTQMRLDFLDFDISGSVNGDCTNDTMTITGVDTITDRIMPTNFCGVNHGQHVYLSVKDSTEIKITINIASANAQSWVILVSQYESTQTDYIAPRGCLQYFREEAGTFMTFNHNSGKGELLNNQMYNICLQQLDQYCDVSLTASNFALGKATDGTCDDAVAFGVSSYCGSTFANSDSLLWNYTGSYHIPFLSDDDNASNDVGFEISYLYLMC